MCAFSEFYLFCRHNILTSSIMNVLQSALESSKKMTVDTVVEKKHELTALLHEIMEECTPKQPTTEDIQKFYLGILSFIHIPYIPALHSPGWLTRYVVGPFDEEWVECLFADFWAGITVALTMVPQGLSYAQLANLPPINGLYAVIPSCVGYALFGSSMKLAVGPVAVVSLLTGAIIAQNIPNYATNTEGAVNLGAEIALACGVLLVGLGVLNLGNFIRYISHPVMSGFTTGAACIIGLNQLKGAFGFALTVPQAGQTGYDYNWQVMRWFVNNWNDRYSYTAHQIAHKHSLSLLEGRMYRNPYAEQICFGLFVPLMIIGWMRKTIAATPERKKLLSFKCWQIASNLMPLVAIIIGAHVAYTIKKSDGFNNPSIPHDVYKHNLKVVGYVVPGINIARIPKFGFPFGQILIDVIPLTLISFMESFSVARRIAVEKGELHLLNASQEMFANGASNLLCSVLSGYPVAGSFSRTSLNSVSGGRTPLSQVVTMIVIIIAVTSLTSTFEYIPNAALAAVIFCAVYNLICISDFWEAWKHSKQDFITMLATFLIVLIFNTQIGLAIGLATSVLFFIKDSAFSPDNAPVLASCNKNNDGVDIIKMHSDLTFITAGRLKDMVTGLTTQEPALESGDATLSERLFHKVTSTLDAALAPQVIGNVTWLPKALVIDLELVTVMDLTGLECLAECFKEARAKKIHCLLINPAVHIKNKLVKYNICYDVCEDGSVDLDQYIVLTNGLNPRKKPKSAIASPVSNGAATDAGGNYASLQMVALHHSEGEGVEEEEVDLEVGRISLTPHDQDNDDNEHGPSNQPAAQGQDQV